MLIDSCASGGRRNDLETLRRAVPLLRSDYQSFAGDPAYAPGNQCHRSLSLRERAGVRAPRTRHAPLPRPLTLTLSRRERARGAVRSHFCPAFGFCWDVRRPGVDWAKFRRLVDDWRKVAPCFLGDYYPLTPYSLSEEVWIAWQFDRPDLGEGIIQAFRRKESPYTSARLKLRGLDPAARYAVTNLDTPGSAEMTGRELVEQGLQTAIADQPGSAIITYRRR
jgi:alpha-galactosidase